MTAFLEKTFGSSWRTSAWGFFTGVCLFLYANPDTLAPLPDYWEHLSKQILTFLMAGGVIKMGTSSRDKVTSAQETAVFKQEAVQVAKQVAATVDRKVERLADKVDEIQSVIPSDSILTKSEVKNVIEKVDALEEKVDENTADIEDGSIIRKLS